MGSVSPDTCLACGGQSFERPSALATALRVHPPEALVRCRRCGFAWVDGPRGTNRQYEADYFEQYRAADSFQAGVSRLPDHLVARLASLEAALGGAGNLVDVGVGFGTLLAAARQRGWQVDGLDVSAWAARHVQDTYGINVRVAAVQQSGFGPGSFDVVHMNHTLEHLDDPLGDLRALRGLLRRSGWLVVEVPNELDDLFETIRWTTLHRRNPPCTDENPHGRFFNARSLRLTLEQAGFQVDRLFSERRNESHDSRLPLGGTVKSAVYAAERALTRGPNLVAWARPGDT